MERKKGTQPDAVSRLFVIKIQNDQGLTFPKQTLPYCILERDFRPPMIRVINSFQNCNLQKQ